MSKIERGSYETTFLVILSLSRGAESRKKILATLLSGPKNCNQIAKELDFDWWTIQKHLHCLIKENLIMSLEFGRIKFYKLTLKGDEAIRDIQAKTVKTSKNNS
ncbi:MAG: winged helix-turn-helix domain-containing protein [Candidatus Bathyarchaeota archaeon]|nr:winged helix-turn-helix domain-containing protein [Candidatus Bathyarchaeota archaeon]